MILMIYSAVSLPRLTGPDRKARATEQYIIYFSNRDTVLYNRHFETNSTLISIVVTKEEVAVEVWRKRRRNESVIVLVVGS